MRAALIASTLASGAIAARPFLNEPDTGIDGILGDIAIGQLPNLTAMVGLPDFDWAARNYLPLQNYTYYRNGAAGEWSYRNNLEVFSRYRLRPRVMVDITNIESTLSTTILGHNFSAPFFISPAARAGYGHPDAELNLMKAAAAENILYMPALYASKSIEEITAVKAEGQVAFQQVYLTANDTQTQELFKRIEASDAKAIVYTVDSAADGNRHRAARFGVGSADSDYSFITWGEYHRLQNMTSIPIIIKGIMSVEDAEAAVENKVPAIILSNHGGRQLDGSPSSLEVALEIYEKDPEIFNKIEIYADGGIRYGADALKLLALGVKAVGLGRPFMYANVFGQEGVEKAIQILKHEIAIDAGNLGVPDLKKIDASYVKWTPNNWYS
ncbi:Cytochrome b2, mitochondrial 4 [Colletotrichum chlorophyti]|uniref:Cytochrome b2, mitochondrial 4 n=1 Tax=Colletotrichum chlorophyti TaxID=708187 RepID=A0A1Q8RGB0_9PEZI|nr:Cytochrome b2, mitochondrial 4 [Colletotrichum chlorophyti]